MSECYERYQFTIEEQPQEKLRFRYKSDDKNHGVLKGKKEIHENETFPQVKLTVPPIQKENEYFVIVSLYHDNDEKEKTPAPHLLKKRSDDDIIVRGPMELKDNGFSFTLKNCYIEHTTKNDVGQSLEKQFDEYNKLGVPLNKSSAKTPDYVHLGFIAFKKETKEKVGGPIYSSKITNENKKRFGIKKVCNLEGDVDGGLDVTILLTKTPGKEEEKKKISIQMQENDEKCNWECTYSYEDLTFENSHAISFILKPYGGTNKGSKIICQISLLKNGEPTDNDETQKPEFVYFRRENKRVHGNKRSRIASDDADFDTDHSHDKTPSNFPTGTTGSASNYDSVRMHSMGTQFPSNIGKRSHGRDKYTIYLNAFEEKFNQTDKSKNWIKDVFSLMEEMYNSRLRRDENDLQKAIASFIDSSSSKFKNGNTILHEAIKKNLHEELKLSPIKSLLSEVINNREENLLHHACVLDKSECIIPLVSLNLKISSKDICGRTPLHIAIEKRHNNCIEKFSEILRSAAEIYPNSIQDLKQLFVTRNAYGFTVMHLAVINNLENLLIDMLGFCIKFNINPCTFGTLGCGDQITHLAESKELRNLLSLIKKYVPDAYYSQNYAGLTVYDMIDNNDSSDSDINSDSGNSEKTFY